MNKELKKGDECWLYIIEQYNRQMYIGITGNLTQRVNALQTGQIKKEKLVYYRSFPDTLTALGFRLLLQKISHSSVDYLIRKMNPNKENLILTI